MRIAITGASGLLGSNIAKFYLDKGYSVYVLVKDEFSFIKLENGINKVYGDVSNKHDVDYFIQKSLPDYFIHLAAQTQAYDSLKYPYNTFFINFVGTLNVLESLREYEKCKSIIVASSDKAYGDLESFEYLESHKLNGTYPYDASKSATDILAKSYKKTYSMPVVSTRACNIYGNGDTNFQRLIPGIIKSGIDGSVFQIRNLGRDIREYIHVQDVVNAYDNILLFNESNNEVDSFNISSGERYSTRQVFDMIQDHMSVPIKHVILKDSGFEIKKQLINSDLLKEKTGWFPKNNLKDSLGDIVSWYKKMLPG